MLFKICKLFGVSSDYILDKSCFEIDNSNLEKISERKEILNAISEFIVMLKNYENLTLDGVILTKPEKEKMIFELEKAMRKVIGEHNSL